MLRENLIVKLGGTDAYVRLIAKTGANVVKQLEAINKKISPDKVPLGQVSALFDYYRAGGFFDDVMETEAFFRKYDSVKGTQKEVMLRRNNLLLQRENNRLKSIMAETDLVKTALERLPKRKTKPLVFTKAEHNAEHLEVLLSDIHIGKKIATYNSQIAKERLEYHAAVVKNEIEYHKPKNITVGILGDVCENTLKHLDSMLGCDSGTPEQLANAILYLTNWFNTVSLPKGSTVVCVAGNHENVGRGIQFAGAGKLHLSYIIYKALEPQFPELNWIIPEGYFAVHNKTLYEHGDFITPAEKSFQTERFKRQAQTGKVIEKVRCGDKHTAVAIDGDRYLMNGAVFSDKEGKDFSGTMGYSSRPAQAIVVDGQVFWVYFDE